MKNRYRAFILSCLLASASVGCAASQPRYFSVNPAWTIDGNQWDLAGLTVVTFVQGGAQDRRLGEEITLLEEEAIKKAHAVITHELTAAYMDYMSRYQGKNLKESEVMPQVSQVVRGVFVKHRYYDSPQQLYYVQAFIPLHRIHSLFKSSFNTDMYITGNGEFKPRQ